MPEIPSDHWLLNPSGDDDAAEIRRLFAEWRAAHVAHRALCDGQPYPAWDDRAFEAAYQRLIDAERRLCEAPASAADGLAVKCYFLASAMLGAFQGTALQPFDTAENDWYADDTGEMYASALALRSLLADAGRLVPELMPLIAAPLASPDHIAVDDEADVAPPGAAIIPFGDPGADDGERAPGGHGLTADEREFLDRMARLDKQTYADITALLCLPKEDRAAMLRLLSFDKATAIAPIDAELAARVAALAAEFRAPKLPPGDAGLIEAERLRGELARQGAALDREFSITAELEANLVNPVLQPLDDKLWEFIRRRSPSGLPGVAVKLRLLREEAGDAADYDGLGKCIAVVEREIAAAKRRVSLAPASGARR